MSLPYAVRSSAGVVVCTVYALIPLSQCLLFRRRTREAFDHKSHPAHFPHPDSSAPEAPSLDLLTQ